MDNAPLGQIIAYFIELQNFQLKEKKIIPLKK